MLIFNLSTFFKWYIVFWNTLCNWKHSCCYVYIDFVGRKKNNCLQFQIKLKLVFLNYPPQTDFGPDYLRARLKEKMKQFAKLIGNHHCHTVVQTIINKISRINNSLLLREAFKKKIKSVEIFHTFFTPSQNTFWEKTIFFPLEIPKHLEKFQCILAEWVGGGYG